MKELFEFEEDQYPMVILSETQCENKKLSSAKSGDKIKLLTYCVFQSSGYEAVRREELLFRVAEAHHNPDYALEVEIQCKATILPEVKVLRQKLIYRERVYLLYDIYGLQMSNGLLKSNSQQQLSTPAVDLEE